jgi:hypothetical protein
MQLFPVTDDFQVCGGAATRVRSNVMERTTSMASALSRAPHHISSSNGPHGAHWQVAVDQDAITKSGEAWLRSGARATAARSSDGAVIVDSSPHVHAALTEQREERASSLRDTFAEVKRMSVCGHALTAPPSDRSRPIPSREERAMDTAMRVSEESVRVLLGRLMDPSFGKPITNVTWHS